MRMNVQLKAKSVLGAMLILVLACACLALYTPLVCSQEEKNENDKWKKLLQGSIEEPADKSKVSRHFEVSGTVYGWKIRHLWLVERIGDQCWPKEPELHPINGHWQGEVNEGGDPPNGTFEILLVDVSQETAEKFKEWLSNGRRTGSYPGLPVSVLGIPPRILDSKIYSLSN